MVTTGRLPRYLVLEPSSTVRMEIPSERPVGELDVELESPRPGRSFLLMVGPQGGPVLRRIRLSGRARIVFEPTDDRTLVMLLANPLKEPLVLRLGGPLVARRRRVPSRTARPPPTPSRRKLPARGRRDRLTVEVPAKTATSRTRGPTRPRTRRGRSKA